MFEWVKKLFNKEPSTKLEIKVGDSYPVKNPDHARTTIGMLCMQSGKIITGEADWNDDGTGTITVSSVNDAPRL